MKRYLTICTLVLLATGTLMAQRVENFTLQNAVDGQEISLEDFNQQTAVVLVFTGLNCPFSRLYEDRLIALHQEFDSKGISFALINPLAAMDDEESQAKIQQRVKTKEMKFPFLMDISQEVARSFEITKLPEVVVITFSPTGASIAYRGAIDNNPQIAANASIKYLENALQAILSRRSPSPMSSRPVGCNLRYVGS
ncbi:redoxin domain-containing protein [Mongoliitalea daihaiensis]|uniref:redoxin domain-containing protein n=1 Tax=Mongoliitalea daihaiensis TaxID=2782006 RepID=UPI001F341A26|nr:redoxin domain-containing protein [Mongoliitalea daihaiensis]UJP64681.1 redoxin domain-containing protein [Mongoliitalea daihaiensis]